MLKFSLPAAALLITAVAAPALAAPAAGDPVLGKRVFIQCQACHTIKAGDPPRTGPTMAGIYGAKAGQRPGFKYSPAVAALKFKWDDASLDRWLTRPSAVAPGTKMAFAGIADPKARANVIAYIKTLK